MTATIECSEFIPRNYDVFIGLDVDKKKLALTCTDHGALQKSLSMPNNCGQLLNYTRKHLLGSE